MAWATLVRLPNLGTAPPDVIAGCAIGLAVGQGVSLPTLVGASFASICLYGAGTVLNDYADAAVDAIERPKRPIPSGEISGRMALAGGLTLLCGGIIGGYLSGGPQSGIVAIILATLIVLYDGLWKGSVLGWVTMGACRGMNVLLGVSLAVNPLNAPPWAIGYAIAIALYIGAITRLAEGETGAPNSRAALLVAYTALLTTVVPFWLLIEEPTTIGALGVGYGLLGCFGYWIGPVLYRTYTDPTPATVGPTVGVCLQGLVLLNGAVAGAIVPSLGIIAGGCFMATVRMAKTFKMS
ncbi:UbiA family prenyltransferase [Halocatena halophila]|uniref:UbiA family prenyltransferase n=1 Tax=Halocatena halophila TaxID=2814576 RepID=UPI002ED5616E